MTNDKRLEHQTPTLRRGGTNQPAHDYKDAETRAEELQTISPVFRRLVKKKATNPSPEQWRRFSQELSRKLGTQDAPYAQRLRDRITATDSVLLRWFWMIVAFLALLAIGAGIGFLMTNQPMSVQVALTSTYQHGESAVECLKCII